MSAPKLPSLFKLPKTRAFRYKPMYYDADKEALKERVARIEREEKLKKELGAAEYALREKMTEKWARKSMRHQRKSSNMRLLLIIGLLTIVAYYFLYK